MLILHLIFSTAAPALNPDSHSPDAISNNPTQLVFYWSAPPGYSPYVGGDMFMFRKFFDKIMEIDRDRFSITIAACPNTLEQNPILRDLQAKEVITIRHINDDFEKLKEYFPEYSDVLEMGRRQSIEGNPAVSSDMYRIAILKLISSKNTLSEYTDVMYCDIDTFCFNEPTFSLMSNSACQKPGATFTLLEGGWSGATYCNNDCLRFKIPKASEACFDEFINGFLKKLTPKLVTLNQFSTGLSEQLDIEACGPMLLTQHVLDHIIGTIEHGRIAKSADIKWFSWENTGNSNSTSDSVPVPVNEYETVRLRIELLPRQQEPSPLVNQFSWDKNLTSIQKLSIIALKLKDQFLEIVRLSRESGPSCCEEISEELQKNIILINTAGKLQDYNLEDVYIQTENLFLKAEKLIQEQRKVIARKLLKSLVTDLCISISDLEKIEKYDYELGSKLSKLLPGALESGEISIPKNFRSRSTILINESFKSKLEEHFTNLSE